MLKDIFLLEDQGWVPISWLSSPNFPSYRPWFAPRGQPEFSGKCWAIRRWGVCSLCPLFSLPQKLVLLPHHLCLPPSSTKSAITAQIQPAHCMVKYCACSPAASHCVSFLPEFCVHWMKTESTLHGFGHHQCRVRDMPIAAHQILDESFRYLTLCFQVFKTIRATVLRLNPCALITELPKHE